MIYKAWCNLVEIYKYFSEPLILYVCLVICRVGSWFPYKWTLHAPPSFPFISLRSYRVSFHLLSVSAWRSPSSSNSTVVFPSLSKTNSFFQIYSSNSLVSVPVCLPIFRWPPRLFGLSSGMPISDTQSTCPLQVLGDGLPGLVLKPIFRNQLFEGLQSGCGCHMAQYKYDYYVDYVNWQTSWALFPSPTLIG